MSMSEERRAVLRAVCDTVVPCVERADDPDGFWARRASDVGAPEALEQVIELMPAFQQEGLAQMLDGLGEIGFATASQRSREQLLTNLNALGPAAAAGVSALAGLTLFLSYGAPDPQTGQNPFWRSFGYPGPAGRAIDRAASRSSRSSRRATSSRSTPTSASSARAPGEG